MERTRVASRRRLTLAAVTLLAVALVLRHVLWALACQLAAAGLLMAMALPLCRLLERRLSPSLASALSLIVLLVAVLAAVGLLLPSLVRQFQQLSAAIPALTDWGMQQLSRLRAFFSRRGVNLTPVRDGLLEQLQKGVLGVASAAAQGLRGAFSSVGTLLLSPLISFYLLRDRRRIASSLTLLAPVKHRARVVRAMREMRRETAGFLRGQLVTSAAVGACTALGLLLVGTPGWLLLGILMGVMELVPYIGPWIAGIPAVLFALQRGLPRAFWALAVILLVQQLEGNLLSPRLLSGAMRLHPLTVLLSISAGGILAGPWGMILSLPLLVSLRGIIRGLRT